MDQEIERRSKDKKPDGFAASVELPEGHQLIIGEMPPGTVVEVATWQGVGRPDESANRFLITTDGPGLRKRELEGTQQENEKNLPDPKLASMANLASLVKNSNAGNFLGVSEEKIRSDHNLINNELAPEGNSKWRNFGRGVFTFVAVISIFSVVLNILGVSVTVPKRGAKFEFGSISNALVIYTRTNSPENHVPLVVKIIENGKPTIVVGPSTVFDAQNIKVDTTKGLEFVNTNGVIGKSMIAIPYLGAIVKPLFN